MGDTVNKEIDMKNYQVRTDLLIDLYTGEYDKEKVDLHTEKDRDIEVVDIVIKDEENAGIIKNTILSLIITDNR